MTENSSQRKKIPTYRKIIIGLLVLISFLVVTRLAPSPCCFLGNSLSPNDMIESNIMHSGGLPKSRADTVSIVNGTVPLYEVADWTITDIWTESRSIPDHMLFFEVEAQFSDGDVVVLQGSLRRSGVVVGPYVIGSGRGQGPLGIQPVQFK